MRYRVGRHNPRIVYRQQADEPSDSDDMMATFFDAIDAMAIVSMLNGDEDDALWADDPIAAATMPAAPADEPAPVPPPVDALQDVVEAARTYGRLCFADGHSGTETAPLHWSAIKRTARALWASGVAEGRREDEQETLQVISERDDYHEIADRLTAAIGRHLGVDLGEHSSDNSPWGNALDALAEADGGKFVKAAHEDGIAEGRRQATEERTEVAVRLDMTLDSPEYRTQLLKMIRTGQIVLPEADHG